MEEPKVIGKECRFAIHIPSKSSDVPDLHLVKEAVHYDNGEIRPNVAFIKNFQRDFYVTKKPYRNHEQKKEYEELDKLTRYTCTQSNMRFAVARALDKAWSNAQLNQLTESPYLYGVDISSASIIKQQYRLKYPDLASPFTVSFLDIETDVIHGTNDPIMATLLMKGKFFYVVQESFFNGYTDIEGRYRATVDKYIGEYIKKHGFEIEFLMVPNAVELIRAAINKIHEWTPDFVAIWNISFDVPKLIETLEKYGVNPADVFSHPSLPPEHRFCKFKKGSTKKITASGQVKPKNPSEQWHSLLAPIGSWFIDQMSSYRFVRQGEQEEQDYKLDTILDKNLGIRKLKFKEAENYHDLEWHIFMQKNYPFEYAVYNNFDCIGCYELELQNNDLSLAVPIRTNISEFSRFDSQTKRFADKYHYFLLERNKVIASLPPKEKEEKKTYVGEDDDVDYIGDFDDDDLQEEPSEEDEAEIARQKVDVLSLRHWIITLKAHMSVLGLDLIAENEMLKTLIRCFVYDSDAVSAYPSATGVANVSRETTLTEIIDIIGRLEADYRFHNLDLLHGHVNALEYCSGMFKLPRLDESLEFFADLH